MSGRANSEDTDNNILAIFLPIVAVALAICAGGCYYVERRRKKKLKFGESVDDNPISDTESVISAASARYRPYLLPATTRSRTTSNSIKTSSRNGLYDGGSTYGEPPPYSGRSRRSSVASNKALKERIRPRGDFNSGYTSSDNSLNRSHSMLDLRSEFEPAPLRRSRSSMNLQRHHGRDSGFGDRTPFSHDSVSRRSEYPSPAQSEWSIRTAPQMSTHDMDYIENRPSSVASLPVRGRRSNLRRSVSQPNLGNSLTKTGTYPQGILKRQGNSGKEEPGRPARRSSTHSRERDYYSQGDSMQEVQDFSQQGENNNAHRNKAYYSGARGRYDSYISDSAMDGHGYPSSYSDSGIREDLYGGSMYSAPPSHSYDRPWGNQYSHQQYDPYSYGSNNYWEQQSGTRQQSRNPYPGYGSSMY